MPDIIELMTRIEAFKPYFLKSSPEQPIFWSPVMKKEYEEAIKEFNERMDLKKPKTK